MYGYDALTSARVFVERWAATQKSINAVGLASLHLDYIEAVTMYNSKLNSKKDKGIRPLPRYVLDCAFEEYLLGLPAIQRKELQKALAFEENNLEPLKMWVAAVTGSWDEVNVKVMAHWCWLVKRRMFERSVVHHIMPLIVSDKQGGGKSTAVHNLITPLNGLSMELKVPQITDERSTTLFCNCLVGFLDEMAGASKVDIDDFKRNVTSNTLMYRPMRTNAQVRVPNLCSFIGSSNNSIFEIIKDTTGIRRFFEIRALDKLDWAVIDGINYASLWKGIDENLSRGYIEEVQVEVAEHQKKSLIRDEVAVFLEDYLVMPTGSSKVVSGKHLYAEFQKHCIDSGIRFVIARQTFYKKLREKGLQADYRRDAGKSNTWFFAVSVTCPILGDKRDDLS